MPEYVALLRGIAPMNPNQKNGKLRRVFEELGFEDVRTVISSGNVLFQSDSTDADEMEAMLEEAWPAKLGFNSTTIIRSIPELQKLVEADPFAGFEHSRETYLLVTFCKRAPKIDFELPHQAPGSATQLIAQIGRELFTVTDTTQGSGADAMGWLDKTFEKEITSRTWLTVHRVLKKAKAPQS
jgi:uncharacterized protein (DUF1697 family)